MQKMYTTQDKILLYVLKAKLEAAGINCIIKNEQPPLAGNIPPIIAWPELWLMDDHQLEQAKKIVQQELAHINDTNTTWTCSQCGETLPGRFNLCWKCGNSRTK